MPIVDLVLRTAGHVSKDFLHEAAKLIRLAPPRLPLDMEIREIVVVRPDGTCVQALGHGHAPVEHKRELVLDVSANVLNNDTLSKEELLVASQQICDALEQQLPVAVRRIDVQSGMRREGLYGQHGIGATLLQNGGKRLAELYALDKDVKAEIDALIEQKRIVF